MFGTTAGVIPGRNAEEIPRETSGGTPSEILDGWIYWGIHRRVLKIILVGLFGTISGRHCW